MLQLGKVSIETKEQNAFGNEYDATVDPTCTNNQLLSPSIPPCGILECTLRLPECV